MSYYFLYVYLRTSSYLVHALDETYIYWSHIQFDDRVLDVLLTLFAVTLFVHISSVTTTN